MPSDVDYKPKPNGLRVEAAALGISVVRVVVAVFVPQQPHTFAVINRPIAIEVGDLKFVADRQPKIAGAFNGPPEP